MDFIMNIVAKLTVRKTGVDRGIYLCIIFLSIFGIVMIGDASVGMSLSKGSNYATLNMAKQIAFVTLGMFAMAYSSRHFKSSKVSLEKMFFIYFIGIAAMCICLAWTINNSHAWIKIGPITVQPAEFMKVILIVGISYLAGSLPSQFRTTSSMSKKKRKSIEDKKVKFCVVYPIVAAGLAFLICGFIQRDLGSALILAGISYFVFIGAPDPFYDRVKKLSYIIIAVLVVGIIILGGTGLASHQIARIASWINPLDENTYYNSSFQIVNGFIGFVNGGLIGKGFGNSVMKYGYIPEAQNDFIAAIIMEELGLIGFLMIIVPYTIIIIRLFKYALKIKNPMEKLILIGTASYFFFHLFVNIGGVSGLIPMTGVPLLLISAGGSSTLAALISIGICQAIISKYNKRKAQYLAENSL